MLMLHVFIFTWRLITEAENKDRKRGKLLVIAGEALDHCTS